MKKLKLNKEIISSLEKNEMKQVKGGTYLTNSAVACLTRGFSNVLGCCGSQSCDSFICIPI